MDVDSMVNLTPGSEGHAALLHEIGHALGLRHPRNVDAGDAWAVQWREADDISSNTVMSGTASVDGLFRADWGVLDVAALRYLYGTHGINGGDSTYVVGGTDAGAQRTIVDDGGKDVLDASSSAVGVVLDLTPGHQSSVGVSTEALLAVGNLGIGLGSWIETCIGSSHDDVLIGNAAANVLVGGLGNDDIDGGAGLDTARFDDSRAGYSVTESFGYRYLTANDGVSGFDILQHVERLRFADETLAFDTDGNAGEAVKLLGVLFNPAIAANPGVIGQVVSYLDSGVDLEALVSLGIDVALPGASSQQLVTLLYTSLFGAAPGPADLAYYSGLIDNHVVTREELTVMAADVVYNLDHVGLAGLAATGIVYYEY